MRFALLSVRRLSFSFSRSGVFESEHVATFAFWGLAWCDEVAFFLFCVAAWNRYGLCGVAQCGVVHDCLGRGDGSPGKG
ncbi:hypothetical protein CC86DRAFT_204085 [Ophiobolus disseminans]|uniref:Uncharacterized protein n=1 Tax=Ophiobolus disseminans TaxID=1469910 RepID=A0A6A7A5T2_9PLEO|nr:hypothetical protein CC86DRAFT_204085 [Ophiobolus disseminans]